MNFKRYLFLRQRAMDFLRERVDGVVSDRRVVDPDMQSYAFLGDAVYHEYIRHQLLATGIRSTQVLHDLAAKMVSARMQAKVFDALFDELTEVEQIFCGRARNADVVHSSSSTRHEYQLSTAWEALLGYLAWIDDEDRLADLQNKALVITIEELENEFKK